MGNELAVFLDSSKYLPEGVLSGSGMIVPKEYKETPFELSSEQLIGIFDLLKDVKKYLDEKFHPGGFNIGWNVGDIGGQNISHVHLHVLPRYKNEKFAGKGIRYWLKDKENSRISAD